MGLLVQNGFHVVWCRFGMLRRHMTYNSSVHELAGIYGLLRVVAAGAPGHGPMHLFLSSAASLRLFWNPDLCVWQRPGLPALCQPSRPFQIGWPRIEVSGADVGCWPCFVGLLVKLCSFFEFFALALYSQ